MPSAQQPARPAGDAAEPATRHDQRPLHIQVAETLRQEISDHRLVPGTALASEVALQRRFAVSRSVVRQALAALATEGLVTRGRGRGTVVAPAREHHRLVTRSSGLFEQLTAEGHTVTTQVLDLVEQNAPADARWLGTERVLRLDRLRSLQSRPLARIRTYLPLPACAGLREIDLTDASLHQVLSDDLHLRPMEGPRQVRAVAAGPELATELDVATGAPLLLLEGQTSDQHSQPLEVFATWHRASDVAFDLQAGHRRPSIPPPVPDLADAVSRARALANQLERLTGL